jgi:hypothetical protein
MFPKVWGSLAEKSEKNMKWVLTVSLIMFFWSTFMTTILQTGYYFKAGPWYYLRNISNLSLTLTIISATLYTADFWKKEQIYKIALGTFIISMSLLFISNMSWISMVLGITPY